MGIAYSNKKQKFSKECLYSALMKLMQKKDIKRITIKELTTEAGFSRMAFYRNYRSIYEIVEEHLAYDLFGGDLTLSPDNFDPYAQLLSMYTYIKNNKILIDNVIKSNLSYMILQNVEIMSRHFLPLLQSYGLRNKYEISAFTGMTYKVILDWATGGMIENPKEIADITYSMMMRFSGNK